MKTILTVSALVIAAGAPCVAFAESLGASVPSFVNTNAIVAAFSVALIALVALGDYARRPRMAGASLLSPTNSDTRPESHRLAA